MKKITWASLILCLSLLFGTSVALASNLRQDWLQTQQQRIAADATYRQAQIDFQKKKTTENEAEVVASAKKLMNAALDEVAAWLKWKEEEAKTDPRVPEEIKNSISADVATNLTKIAAYRQDVAGVKNRAEAVLVYLKLVGGYGGLLADVARNTGAMWGAIGDRWTETAEKHESRLRTAAESRTENKEILNALNIAKAAITKAKANIVAAKASYKNVRVPGTPFIKFAEGNASLRAAQINLLEAQGQMLNALSLLTTK